MCVSTKGTCFNGSCQEVPYISKFLDTIKALLHFYSHSSQQEFRTMQVVDNNWIATINHLSIPQEKVLFMQ